MSPKKRGRPTTHRPNHASFESSTKVLHRAVFAYMYHASLVKNPMAYLDCERGKCTSHLLKSGVPEGHLIPVNRCSAACEGILKATGVTARCAMLHEYLVCHQHMTFAAVWMDLTCTSTSVEELRAALSVTKNVMLALSIRGTSHSSVLLETERVVRKAGGVMQSHQTYVGAGGIRNMLAFFITRREGATLPRPTKGKPIKTKAKPIKTALAKKEKKKRSSHVEAVAASLVGRDVALPTSLWGGSDVGGYEFAARANGTVRFQIASTFFRRRLTLRARFKNGKLAKDKEMFTLEVDEVQRYLLRD